MMACDSGESMATEQSAQNNKQKICLRKENQIGKSLLLDPDSQLTHSGKGVRELKYS